MKRWNKFFLMPLIILLFLFVQTNNTSAAQKTDLQQDKQGQVGYSVQKLSKDDSNSAFFDLNIKAKDEKKLKARIYNETDKAIKVKMSIFTASTSSQVQIIYTKKSPKNDTSMQYYIEDLVKIDGKSEVEVPAKSSVDVSATMKIPKEISGTLLGSWYFEKVSEDKTEETSEGVNINNQYSYAIAIKLQATQISDPNINLLNVEAGLDNYERAIIATMQNDKATIMSKLTMDIKVKDKETSKVLYSKKMTDLKIAPNTTFEVPTAVEGDLLKAGNYIYEATIKTADKKWSKNEWKLSKEFKITDQQAKKLNDEAINEDNSRTSPWIIALIIVGSILLIALAAYLILKQRTLKSKRQRPKKPS